MTLAEVGIDQEGFISRMAPTFKALPFDPYDPALAAEALIKKHVPAVYDAAEIEWLSFWKEFGVTSSDAKEGPRFWAERVDDLELIAALENLAPHRRRSCFQFVARQLPAAVGWNLLEKGAPAFCQSVSDSRSRPRRFALPPPAVYRDASIHQLIGFACQWAIQVAGTPRQALQVTMHQMLTLAKARSGSRPAPEGLHQDGAGFIVSALVVERCNVTGGTSRVYYDAGRHLAMAPRELQPGEGIFQADKLWGYWHDVTPIYPNDPARESYRSIIGLDINILDDDSFDTLTPPNRWQRQPGGN
jgi:hypothetical protein